MHEDNIALDVCVEDGSTSGDCAAVSPGLDRTTREDLLQVISDLAGDGVLSDIYGLADDTPPEDLLRLFRTASVEHLRLYHGISMNCSAPLDTAVFAWRTAGCP